ncbi:MAG TPA: hypothetical protein VEM96_06010 [Pyrinomonadaceae bacterium]|nr:hypothetical protein [Pyrinomonadaceae bacterium]
MRKLYPLATALLVYTFASLAFGREARLVRYPSYSNGRIAFTYLGDIWTASRRHRFAVLRSNGWRTDVDSLLT